MIQRIQTIYLLLSAISLIMILLLPVGYQEAESGVVANIAMSSNLPTFILSILSGIVAVFSIFLFNNRKLQLRITSIVILLAVLTLSSLVFYLYVIGKDIITSPNFIPYVLAGFGIIFGILAYRGIDADDKLVRSMDRLR